MFLVVVHQWNQFVYILCDLWFAVQGDLRSYVTQHEWLYRNGELLQLQKMACEIAAGLTHLHKHNFLHRLFFHCWPIHTFKNHFQKSNFNITFIYYYISSRKQNISTLNTTWGAINLHIKVTVLLPSLHGIPPEWVWVFFFLALIFLRGKRESPLKASFCFNLYPAWYLVEVRPGLSRVSCHTQLGLLSFAYSEYMQRSPITQLLGIAGCPLSFGTETWWFCDSSVNRSPSYFWGEGPQL